MLQYIFNVIRQKILLGNPVVVFVFIQAKVAEQNIFSVSAFRIETDKLN
jgi:hypothetical protein